MISEVVLDDRQSPDGWLERSPLLVSPFGFASYRDALESSELPEANTYRYRTSPNGSMVALLWSFEAPSRPMSMQLVALIDTTAKCGSIVESIADYARQLAYLRPLRRVEIALPLTAKSIVAALVAAGFVEEGRLPGAWFDGASQSWGDRVYLAWTAEP